MNVAWHDADLDFVRGNDAGAIRSEQQGFLAALGFFLRHLITHFQHIAHRNAFGNANHKIQVRFNRFPNCSSSAWRRYIDNGCGCAGLLGCFFYRSVNGNIKNRLACFFGIDARYETIFSVCVLLALLSMKLPGLTGNALRNYFCIFVNQN